MVKFYGKRYLSLTWFWDYMTGHQKDSINQNGLTNKIFLPVLPEYLIILNGIRKWVRT